jgi:hypothetical protein
VSERVGGGGIDVHVTPISCSSAMASIVACFPRRTGARPRESNFNSSAVRAIRWKSPACIEASHSHVMGG